MAVQRHRGFSLIELVLVVAIIAILAVVLVPAILDVAHRSRERTARGTLVNLQKVYARFHQDTSRWPEGSGYWDWSGQGQESGILDGGFTAFRELPLSDSSIPRCWPGQAGSRCWNGPYLLQDLAEVRDPWGNHYRFFYRPPSADWADTHYPSCPACDALSPNAPAGALVIYSLGRDGRDGTGCIEPMEDGCEVNPERVVDGLPSREDSDDIVVMVASSVL